MEHTFKHLLLSLAATLMACLGCLAEDVDIELNGADWSSLGARLSDPSLRTTIVHIGDSHLQADRPTSHLRHAFQRRYGNAGRGIVSPLKMSGTYQPDDYQISSPDYWSAARFLRYPWAEPMGFSGTALRPAAKSTSLTFSAPAAPFTDITIYHRGDLAVKSVTNSRGERLEHLEAREKGAWTGIYLDRPEKEVTVHFDVEGDFVFHTASLLNGRTGVVYDCIGNGGSDIHMYNLIPDFADGVSRLEPDLIIVALGTNDSYNNFSTERFRANLDAMVSGLRLSSPQAKLLIVTPMEIQMGRATKVTRKSKSRKGRRARTVTSRIKTYAPVSTIPTIHKVILDYAREKGIAVYDWYEATGGAGASARWVDEGLMLKDHIHLTPAGYRKHADMLFNAIEKALTQPSTPSPSSPDSPQS